ncbi:MAG: hypothetical protein Q7S16_03140 [bacterium]|nr:hypothetical protein [bacterium]
MAGLIGLRVDGPIDQQYGFYVVTPVGEGKDRYMLPGVIWRKVDPSKLARLFVVATEVSPLFSTLAAHSLANGLEKPAWMSEALRDLPSALDALVPTT